MQMHFTMVPMPMTAAEKFSDAVHFFNQMVLTVILMHYEQFDSRYKGVLPLKRVYLPDPDETGKE
jgi:restriction system protein